MKLVLIQSPVPELLDDKLDPPINLLYLAGSVSDIADVKIIDLCGLPEKDWKFPEADFYGFSTYTSSYYRTVKIKRWINCQYPNAKFIAGGPHATALPNEVAEDFDHVVVGEGESVLRRILLGTLTDKIIEDEPIQNLDKIQIPNYNLLDMGTYTRLFEGKPAFPLFSSRGCPHKCAFCSSSSWCYWKKPRYRSVLDIQFEIRTIRKQFGDVSFRFKDDLFPKDFYWMHEFLANDPEIVYSANVRTDTKPDIVCLLGRSGCKVACVGYESGDNAILKAMGKRSTREKAIKTTQLLKDIGIKVLGWFIVGFPGETWDSVKRTVDLINELNLDKTVVYPLIPYPGTDLYKNPEKYGMEIIDKDFSHYFYIRGNYEAGYVYKTDTLNPEIIQEMREYVIMNTGISRL